MNKLLVDIFACPYDKGKLEVIILNTGSHSIKQGLFYCSKCNDVFPIIDGIPRFLIAGDIDALDQKEWDNFIHSKHMNRLPKRYLQLFTRKIEDVKERTTKHAWTIEEKSYWESIYNTTKDEKTKYTDGLGRVVGNRRYIRELLIFSKLRQSIEGKILLEVGCGGSRNIKQLLDPATYNFYYIGLDLSIKALKRALDNIDGIFVQANLEYLPFKDNSVDYLLSLGALHHTPAKEENLRKLYCVLKSGGELAYHEVINSTGMAPCFLKDQKLPHHEHINLQKALRIDRKHSHIIAYKKEYSPIRAVMVKLLEPLMNMYFYVTRFIILIDDMAIGLSKYLEFLHARSALVLTRKK
ncbi:MAG: methyltransferase domain-containing protein [bacterium]